MAKGAVDKANNDFQRSLRCFAELLRRRAGGRVCGDCRFYVSGVCVMNDIEVHYKDAVACERHEER